MSEEKNRLSVGDRVQCTIVDSNPNGLLLFSEQADANCQLILDRKVATRYEPGEAAEFWVIHVSQDGSFCFLSDNGFGMMPVSDRMRPRYVRALNRAIEVVGQGATLEVADATAFQDLKGMYSRSYRKDQWDWVSVWKLLGEPRPEACQLVADVLGVLAKEAQTGSLDSIDAARDEIPSELITSWQVALERLRSEAPRVQNESRRAAAPSTSVIPKTIESRFDSAKLERANKSHADTLLLLMRELVERGFTPHEHDRIDLFCQLKTGPAVFEVKSIFENNEETQFRGAFSQLSYYRFLASRREPALAKAGRWLVLSSAPIRRDLVEWMEAEGVSVIWRSGDRLMGSSLPWDLNRTSP